MSLAELIALLRAAAPAERAALIAQHADSIAGFGLTVEDVTTLVAEAPAAPPADPPAAPPAAPAADAGDNADDRELVGAAAEGLRLNRESALGRMIVREAVAAAQLPAPVEATLARTLPAQFTEAELADRIASIRQMAEGLELLNLAPTAGTAVTGDARDRAAERVYQTLLGNYREGFRSLRQAFAEVEGLDRIDLIDGDVPSMILRESLRSSRREGLSERARSRVRESVDSSTWGEVLGDSITRRLLDVYRTPEYQVWRRVVSSTPPVMDFRTNRRVRMGGYGVLPAVAQSGTYQPLDSPTDEEATYAIAKKGGTEDLTLEAIANDDLRAVQRIPVALGRAAAMTLYRHVFDYFTGNAAIYDSVALFDAAHANTDTTALSGSAVSTGRQKMRTQAAYGVAQDVLGITPRLLLVPNELEELAFQITSSAVVVNSTEDATIPNIHNARNLEAMVIDYWTDDTAWYMVADPGVIDTLEVGFYLGREDPELFVQDDPRVGATFDADKVTWKIRHIYGSAVLDYRGFYRGNT